MCGDHERDCESIENISALLEELHTRDFGDEQSRELVENIASQLRIPPEEVWNIPFTGDLQPNFPNNVTQPVQDETQKIIR